MVPDLVYYVRFRLDGRELGAMITRYVRAGHNINNVVTYILLCDKHLHGHTPYLSLFSDRVRPQSCMLSDFSIGREIDDQARIGW